jgi:4-hydroxybenzoate polyprenyltransferase
MGHDSRVRVIRSLGCAVISLVAAVVLGLGSCICAAAPASATTASAMTQAYNPPPSPLTVMMTPLTVGMHVIEAIAERIADAVEFIATPAPIAVPAPHFNT